MIRMLSVATVLSYDADIEYLAEVVNFELDQAAFRP